MNKILFFDAGPVISLTMSRLIWILPKLKEQFGGKFYITPAVKYELVDRPINVKRFGFEALQVLKLIRKGVLEIYKNVPTKNTVELKRLANSAFRIKGKTMDILQAGELESLACVMDTEAAAIVMDERTLRLLIEDSSEMKKLLHRRSKSKVEVDQQRIRQFSKHIKGVNIIRSIELVGVAYRMGLLDSYIPKRKLGRSILLDGVLWATKFNGCAVTPHEIEEMKKCLLS